MEETVKLTKTCKTCGEEKSISEFYKNSSNPDGLDLHCKECKKAYNRRQYRLRQESQIASPISSPATDLSDRHSREIIAQIRVLIADAESQRV